MAKKHGCRPCANLVKLICATGIGGFGSSPGDIALAEIIDADPTKVPTVSAVNGQVVDATVAPMAQTPSEVALQLVTTVLQDTGTPTALTNPLATDATGAGTLTFTPNANTPGNWPAPVAGVKVEIQTNQNISGGTATITVDGFTAGGRAISVSGRVRYRGNGQTTVVYLLPAASPLIPSGASSASRDPMYMPLSFRPALAAPNAAAQTVIVTIAGGPASSNVTCTLLTRFFEDVREFVAAYVAGSGMIGLAAADWGERLVETGIGQALGTSTPSAGSGDDDTDDDGIDDDVDTDDDDDGTPDVEDNDPTTTVTEARAAARRRIARMRRRGNKAGIAKVKRRFRRRWGEQL